MRFDPLGTSVAANALGHTSPCSRSRLRQRLTVAAPTTLVASFGKPKLIVSDNGTEFTSNAIFAVGETDRCRVALHRAGSSHAERHLRGIQRPDAGRTPQ